MDQTQKTPLEILQVEPIYVSDHAEAERKRAAIKKILSILGTSNE